METLKDQVKSDESQYSPVILQVKIYLKKILIDYMIRTPYFTVHTSVHTYVRIEMLSYKL